MAKTSSSDRHEATPQGLPGTPDGSVAALLGSFSVGIFLVDRRGAVTFANEEGQRLLEQRVGIRIRQGRLETYSRDAPDLAAELATIASRPSKIPVILSLPRDTDTRPLTLALVSLAYEQGTEPAPIHFAVFVADPHRRIRAAAHVVAKLYRLTNAERRLLRRLLEGGTLREAAKAIGIGYSTARSQMLSMLRKTSVRRQSELIALCMASSINLRTDTREPA